MLIQLCDKTKQATMPSRSHLSLTFWSLRKRGGLFCVTQTLKESTGANILSTEALLLTYVG